MFAEKQLFVQISMFRFFRYEFMMDSQIHVRHTYVGCEKIKLF